MTLANEIGAPLRQTNRFFAGGEWIAPSSDSMIDVIDSSTEQPTTVILNGRPAGY